MGETNVEVRLVLGEESHRPLRYRVQQSLDGFDVATCELTATELAAPGPAQDYLGQTAHLAFQHELLPADHYSFFGFVTRAEDFQHLDGTRSVALTLEGPLWPLSRRRDSRIFRNLSGEAIVREVLSTAGIAADAKFTGDVLAKRRVYTVQYDEADSAFLTRLLGEMGVSWALHMGTGEPVLHFTDQVEALLDSPIGLDFRTSFGAETENGTVTHLEFLQCCTPDATVVSAYDPHRPSFLAEGTGEAPGGPGQSEIYWPLSRAVGAEENKTYAQRLLEGHLTKRSELRGITGRLGLEPGSRIAISGHPFATLNAEYIVFSVQQFGQLARLSSGDTAEPSYRQVKFLARPASRPLRPLLVQPDRKVPGVQTALTTGPAGEEIHTNEHGEVTVSFHWDRSGVTDENSSRFMRTSQLPTGGSMLLPRMGWEVVVGYHEGDVDQPLVLSRLYNGGTMPPYALPEGALRSSLQTATSPGGGSSNELRMDDTKGNEQMFFNASKDMTIEVGNNTTHSVGNDYKVKIGANQKLTVIDSEKVTVGGNQTLAVTGNQTLSVESLAVDDVTADHAATVGGNRMQMIGGDSRCTVGGDQELTVGGNEMVAVLGSISVTTKADFTQTVGAALIDLVGGDRSVIIAGASSETTGAAKVIVAKGNYAVEVGSLATTIGGALLSKVKGDRSDSAGSTWNETAAGLEKAEAEEIVIEATGMLTVTMGGATLILNPAMIAITGADIKLDGALVEVAPMIVTN